MGDSYCHVVVAVTFAALAVSLPPVSPSSPSISLPGVHSLVTPYCRCEFTWGSHPTSGCSPSPDSYCLGRLLALVLEASRRRAASCCNRRATTTSARLRG